MEVSRSKEIVGEEEVETVVQMVCKSCKRIQARCKCNKPNFAPVTSVYKRSLKQIADDNKQHSKISTEESKRIYDEKMAAKNAKKADQRETIRIAQMDEEDLEKELKEKSTNSEMARWEADREREMRENVDEIQNLKKSLQAQGKNKLEIKTAVNELTTNQKKRGRPALDAVKNPVKDPVSGEFKTDETAE